MGSARGRKDTGTSFRSGTGLAVYAGSSLEGFHNRTDLSVPAVKQYFPSPGKEGQRAKQVQHSEVGNSVSRRVVAD